jgi:hypothetical protein
MDWICKQEALSSNPSPTKKKLMRKKEQECKSEVIYKSEVINNGK